MEVAAGLVEEDIGEVELGLVKIMELVEAVVLDFILEFQVHLQQH
jgi:hypothetical protein